MTYEWTMTPIKDLRISSDNLGINAYYKDEVVSISWRQVFDAIDTFKPSVGPEIYKFPYCHGQVMRSVPKK